MASGSTFDEHFIGVATILALRQMLMDVYFPVPLIGSGDVAVFLSGILRAFISGKGARSRVTD